MPRYAALLRGVSPMNAKTPELRKAFESAGFEDVKTVLASGNVVFSAKAMASSTLAGRAEAAMKKTLGRSFSTIIRRIGELREVLGSNPYARFRLVRDSKRMVTFLHDALSTPIALPIERDGARILVVNGTEAFGTYRSGRGPTFMKLIDETFGKDVTTRTWQTVEKIARQDEH